jgi:CheY-like chemotaxis protein
MQYAMDPRLLRYSIDAEEMLESIPHALFAISRDWRIIYVNARAEALLGHGSGTLLEELLWERCPGLADGQLETLFTAAMAEGAAQSTSHYSARGLCYEVAVYPAYYGIAVCMREVGGAQQAREPAVARAQRNQGVRRVLVADADHDAAQSLAMLVQLLGHEVYVAHTGLEALKKALSAPPDIVLMDMGLPLLSGSEVAEHIRGEAVGADITLVALIDERREPGPQAPGPGFDHRLTKPLNVTAVESLLAMYEPRRRATEEA